MTGVAYCVQFAHGRWMKGAIHGDGLLRRDHHCVQFPSHAWTLEGPIVPSLEDAVSAEIANA